MTFIQERRVGEPIPLFIVFNLGARHGDAESFKDTIRSTLEQAGRAYEIFEVDDPRDLPGLTQHAVARAKADKGAIVGAGGDGTMNAVAQAAYDNNLPFGVLPHGTFNYFSRVNDIPLEIGRTADRGGTPHASRHGQRPPVSGQRFNGPVSAPARGSRSL
jgi:diacylglycerol kinase family enzyme